MLKKAYLILLVVITVLVFPLSSFAQSENNTISADEVATRLQNIFDKYGDGKYQLKDYDKNQVLEREKTEKMLNDIKQGLINRKEENTKVTKQPAAANLLEPRGFWRINYYTEYASGYDNIYLVEPFGIGKVDVSWNYGVGVATEEGTLDQAYVSCSDPTNIHKSYTGAGQVIYNNVTSSNTYLYNPHPVYGYCSLCTYVSGEIQIEITVAGFTFTISDSYTVQKTHTL
jgi:hypothetical protein